VNQLGDRIHSQSPAKTEGIQSIRRVKVLDTDSKATLTLERQSSFIYTVRIQSGRATARQWRDLTVRGWDARPLAK